MKTDLYLIFNIHGFVASRKTPPDLAGGEIGVKVAVEIPNKWFHRSIPYVTLILPEPPDAESTIEFDPNFIEAKKDNDNDN